MVKIKNTNKSLLRSSPKIKLDTRISNMMARMVFIQNKLIYKKVKENKYRCYCFVCDQYKDLSSTEIKQVRASEICPSCFTNIKISRKTELTKTDYVCYATKDKKYFGYSVTAVWNFGRKPKIKSRKLVYFSDDDKQIYGWRRGVVRGIGYQLWIQHPYYKGFKRCRFDYVNHFAMFVDNDDFFRQLEERKCRKKKDYYGEIFTEDLEFETDLVKSNQKKLIQDGIYNRNQLMYILLFDLKSWEDLYKYRKYIKNNNLIYRYNVLHTLSNRLNIFYLDYLDKNNISSLSYIDYVEQCDQLGVKLDKPKNFREKHAEYSQLIEINKNEIYSERLSEYYKDLKQYSYTGRKVQILPFESTESIIECGEKLHNCIASYIKNYALKRCALFYMMVDNELSVAIEVRAGILIQAYQDFNEDVTIYQNRFIKKWLNVWGWRDGR